MNTLSIIHFKLINIRMCADVTYIVKVIPLTQLQEVPGSESHLVGLLNLAGNSVPVFDLAMWLGHMRTARYSIDNPIIICEHNEYRVCFVVDEIVEIDTIARDQIQAHEEFKSNPSIQGVVLTGSVLSLLLDLEKIITSISTNAKSSVILNKDEMNLTRRNHTYEE